jgi:threonine dehydrogenase-like Zn-dependent dehydrogenase
MFLLTSRCAGGQLFGWVQEGRGLPGVQAEYARVPLADTTLTKFSLELPPELALLAGDVLATGWFGAECAGAQPWSTIAVVGCGAVGLTAVIAAQELGAERVFAVDALPERLALAARFGAEPLDLGSDAVAAVAAVREATKGRGVDGVVEAVGSPEATRLAWELARPGGTIAAVGVHTEAHLAVAPGALYDKNLTYRAGRCPARHYLDRLMPLVHARRTDLAALISHRLPLAEAPHAYDLFDRRLEGCTKVVLIP